jgi:ABC-2 type transport system permease protein
MKKILRIAQREYNETVRTKTFLLGILVMPVLIAGLVFLGGRAARDTTSARPTRSIAVRDRTGHLWEEIDAVFKRHSEAFPQRKLEPHRISAEDAVDDAVDAAQEARVNEGKVSFYVVVDPNVVAGGDEMRVYSRRTVAVDMVELQDPNVVAGGDEMRVYSRRTVAVDVVELQTVERLLNQASFNLRCAEEKSSRVIEVVLSAVSPFELLAGKILGLGGIGLTVIALWLAAAYGAARWGGVEILMPAHVAVYLVIYYVLGFLMFSAILAGIGSICNTIKEAQSLMMPLTMLFILPMMAWFYLVKEPDGMLTRVLSFIPPMTPLVMALRLSANPDTSTFETLATIAVLAAFVPCVIWAMAKVFRTGVLLYGKRPGLREVLRWLRQS